MKHILFTPNPDNRYSIAILIKETAFIKDSINTNYVQPLINRGVTPDSILALSLTYNDKGKAPVKLIKESLQTILKASSKLGVNTLVVADSAYFKTLTNERKSEPHFGYIKPCAIKGFEHVNIILSVNYQAIFYNPEISKRLDMSLDTVVGHMTNTHVDPGQNIIKFCEYPDTVESIQNWLTKLLDHPVLTCDIEAKSLNFWEAGIATISFAWNKHEGIAFAVDRGDPNILLEVRACLKKFFEDYDGTLIYHNGTYDIKVLIYELFMDNLQDDVGIFNGLDVMYKNIEDTKLITYLATNTTAGNKLSLKHNSFEFTGNYGIL